MKPIVALLIFAVIGGGAWFGGDHYSVQRRASVNKKKVNEAELRTTLDQASKKAYQVLSYTTNPHPPAGTEREHARRVTAEDFNGERFSEEAHQKRVEELPSVLIAALDEFKLTGAPAFQTSGRIEISDLRGTPRALLSFMKKTESIAEIRFVSATWDVQETTPVLHLEYDIWKPDASPSAAPTAAASATSGTTPNKARTSNRP